MYLKNLKLSNFRNFKELILDFSEECIVFEGKNGIGKTNLLESIYLLSTGKSQRKSKRIDMISFDYPFFFVEGSFCFKNKSGLTVAVGYDRTRKGSFLINNENVARFSDWFGNRPVISFDSTDILLISGPPENRRKFIDFFGSYFNSEYVRIFFEYRYWLSQRNKILTTSFDDLQCDLYDEKLAVYGSEIIAKRQEFFSLLCGFFSDIYCHISGLKDSVEIKYNSSLKLAKYSNNEWKNVFYDSLSESRNKDKSLGFTSIGPHRDNFTVFLNGKDARLFGSQGQCRSLSLSLKLSSSLCLEQQCKEKVIYLIDDILSELDAERTYNFFSLIRDRGQVFIATPTGKLTVKKDFHFIDITAFH
jgi:DNA replication and repair protein RecF